MYEFVCTSNLIATVSSGNVFCKHSMWISTCTFLGCTPDPRQPSSDDSDACDAVLRISLYHIPDSASLASSASFGLCVFRSIIIFVLSSCKPRASFYYIRDDGDGGDDVSDIPLPPCPISIVTVVTIVTQYTNRQAAFHKPLACFL